MESDRNPKEAVPLMSNGSGFRDENERQRMSLVASERARKALTNRFLDEGTGELVKSKGHTSWSWADYLLGTNRGQWGSLMIIGLALIIMGVIGWIATGGNADYDASIWQSLWISWGLFFDPGTQTGIAADDPGKVKFVAMLFSVLGFIYNLSLLGLIVDLIRNTLEMWRLRRSRIVCNNHTLILGLSERTVLLLHELLLAYEGRRASDKRGRCCCRRCCRKRRAVVILADRDELEMEQVVTSHLIDHGVSTQEIYFRKGDPQDWRELSKVSTASADDIIVCGRGYGSPQESDQEVLRIILALAALPKQYQVTGEVFAEMRISENVPVVNTVLETASGIVARVAVNRMFCLMGMDTAVGKCMVDLVSFKSGNQLFNIRCPSDLCGTTFEEACYAFPDAILIGAKIKEDKPGILHPFGRKLKLSDKLLVLADTMERAQRHYVRATEEKPSFVPTSEHPAELAEILSPKVECICMIGCPADYIDLLGCINLSVAPGSMVYILSERQEEWRAMVEDKDFGNEMSGFTNSTPNLEVKHVVGPTTSRRHLSLLPIQHATAVLIMSENLKGDEGPSAADSANLNSVVAITRLPDKPSQGCRVICEMQDNRSEIVIDNNDRLKHLCHYFHSNMLETAMFAMAAEDRAVFNSLLELLTPGRGSQMISIPIQVVLERKEELSFWQLHKRVLQRCGGILIGFYLDGYPDEENPLLNPPEKEHIRPRWQQRLGHIWDPSRQDKLLAVVRPPADESEMNGLSNCPPGESRPCSPDGESKSVLPGDGSLALPGTVTSTPSLGAS